MQTYLTEPTDAETLKSFYKHVRPWGFWKPVHELVVQEEPGFKRNKNFKRDMFNVAIGTLWQTSLVALPMYIVFHQFTAAFITAVIAAVFTVILKYTWYDKLNEADV